MNGRARLISVFVSLALFPMGASAATSIDVTLWDKGSGAEMMTGMGYGMGTVDRTRTNMGIKLSRDRAPAGEITFKVTNSSKDTIHEMIVVAITAKNTPLPYVEAENRIDEDAAAHLGEVSELEPGKVGSLTLNLKPGTYLMLCDVPMHYMGGMWQLLTVTP